MKELVLRKDLAFALFGAGFGIILIIGILSGFVARPGNCKNDNSPTTQGAVPTTTTQGVVPTTTQGVVPTTTQGVVPTTTQASVPTTTEGVAPTTTQFLFTTTTNPLVNLTLPSTTIRTTNSPTTSQPTLIRLPTFLYEPVSYDLTIKAYFSPYALPTNPSDEYFEGTVAISFKLNNNTNSIILHADPSLTIYNSATLLNTDTNEPYTVTQQSLPNQLVSFDFEHSKNAAQTPEQFKHLPAGNYLIRINYRGEFGSLSGFFRTRYDEDNRIK